MQEEQKNDDPRSQIPRFVWNRRYQKLQELIKGDEYFQEECIRMRDPILYFLYVGQYRRNTTRKSDNEGAFYEFLIEQLQKNEFQIKLNLLYNQLKPDHDFPKLDSEREISETDLEDNEDQMIRLMHDKFMLGLDGDHINYEEIDNDSSYDDHKQIQQDMEDKYYESEEIDFQQNSTVYTGELDY